MAKLDRKDVKIFAENSKETLITEFRSENSTGDTASFSRDPDVIQNENYSQGWVNDSNNLNTKIYGEDLNAVSYVLSYLLKYLYENGIAEWKNTTTYCQNSISKIDDTLYISLQDNNLGNDPINTVGYWRAVVLDTITSVLAGNGADIVKAISGNHITFKSLSVDGYGSLQDNGDNINIHVLGGSGIIDAYWGQIQGTLTNQADLIEALGDKQDSFTVSTPLDLTSNVLSLPQASATSSGYLSASDWSTFSSNVTNIYDTAHSWTASQTFTEPTYTRNIIPQQTNTYSLGSSDNQWDNIYSNTVHSTTVESDTNKTDKIQGLTATSVETGASIVPDTDSIYSLGSSTNVWNAIHCNYLYLSGTAIVGALTSSGAISGTSGNFGGDIHFNKNGTEIHQGGDGNWVYRLSSTGTVNRMTIINSSGVGVYLVSGNTSWSSDSDLRLKKNIINLENSLEKIEQLRPIKYDFKTDETNNSDRLGFIAQEMKEIIPEIVDGEATESETLSLRTMDLIPFLTKAIQELNAKVEELESKIKELEK